MWWQHHTVAVVPNSRDWETGQNQGSFNVAKYREALEEKLLQVAHNLRLV